MKTTTKKILEKIKTYANLTPAPITPTAPTLFAFFQNEFSFMMRDLEIKGLIEKMGAKINYQ